MPVSVQWDNEEKTALRYDMEGAWTWDEFHLAAKDGRAMRIEVKHMVDVIANLENSTRIPPNAITQLKHLSQNDRENHRLTIIAGGGGFAIAMVRIYTRVFKTSEGRVKAFKTLAEARQFSAGKTSIKE